MNTIRTLIIEDTEADARLALLALEKGGLKPDWKRVENAEELRAALESGPWDVVISDYNLPGFGAMPALEILKKEYKDVPFIIVSGAVGEEAAVDLMKAGASDFVMKSKLSQLPAAVSRALREVSARRREKEARESAEKANLAREQVLSIVSHDMKNPLGAIDLNLQLIQRLLDAAALQGGKPSAHDQQIRQQVERARRSAQRMKNLITDILDQTKIESGRLVVELKRERVEDLVSEIVEMFQPMAMQKSLLLEFSLPEEEGWADFDHERIFQVLTNLVGNAIKFTPALGKIELKLELMENEVHFDVKDSGPGIPSEHQKRIFERFWQVDGVSRQGVGLGLSIAHGIVKAHGGTINVESEPGRGSCFKIRFPRWKSGDASANAGSPGIRSAAESDVEPVTAAGEPILLVDDDQDLRQVIQQTLVTSGYEVHAVADGEEGIRHLLESGNSPSLVLLDYSLPGINGAEFIQRMHLISPAMRQVPIILSSADTDLEEKAKRLPVFALLKKPTTLPEMLGAVKKAIQHRSRDGLVEERSTSV